MKKVFLLLLTLIASAVVSTATADDIKDNSLQLDDSRLEKKEGLKFGIQSEQVKDLFNEATQKKLQEMQHYQEEQLITERGQLFSAIQGPVKNNLQEQLFQPNSGKLSKFQTNLDKGTGGELNNFMPEMFYVGVVLLLMGGTGLMSYRVMADNMD